jgi:hypothetical protein
MQRKTPRLILACPDTAEQNRIKEGHLKEMAIMAKHAQTIYLLTELN